MMFRLFEILGPFVTLAIGWTQILRPVIKGKPMFPAVRTFANTLLGRDVRSGTLLESAEQHRKSAALRLRAAELDAEAVRLEKAAQDLEDRANHEHVKSSEHDDELTKKILEKTKT